MAADTAQAILARFPGPVTLAPSKFKMFAAFAMCAGLLVFCIAVLVPKVPDAGWYDAIMTVLATVVLAGLVVRLGVLLLKPGALGLTLDVDGFEVRRILRRDRSHWWDVDGFRADENDGIPFLRYDVRSPGGVPRRRGAKKATGTLAGAYPLPMEDIAWLMGEWRTRALAQERQSVVPHIVQVEGT